MASGFEGTYPILATDTLVLKLFGYFPGWRRSFEAEDSRSVSAPKVVATGSLFPDERDAWPFLIFERLTGRAWREAQLTPATALSVAADLGRQIVPP
jgi:hypothetical protein